MDNERLDALFEAAVTIPSVERARWLDEHCGGDIELRRELERLLAADAIAEGVLEHASELLAGNMTDAIEMPQRFGIWRVLGALGAGGMGSVWLAERDDGQFHQRAAIKQVAFPTPGLLRRFREERQILARLEHPGIARLIDGGVDEKGCPWLAMEYVEGMPITQWVRVQHLNTRATVELILRICDAVQFAHRNLIVHSDIKPSNILVADGTPKLLDFGIAKVLAQDDAERTRTMAQLLTPDYAAPELLAGGAITTSVDVYALGVLTGATIKPPSAVIDDTLPDAKARRRAVHGDLDRIVLTAMALEPARRYASVEALSADLCNWLAGRAINARGHGRWYRLGKFVVRHRAGTAAAMLIFAALLVATLYSTHQARIARMQTLRANAVRDFVVGVFEQADPDARQGNPITAHELLDQGDRQLARGGIGSDASRTEMEGLIGHLYWRIGDYPKAVSLIRDAVAHPDPATPAEVRAQNLLYLAHSEVEKASFDAATMHARQARILALQAGETGAGIASEARRVYADALSQDGRAGAAESILRQALQEDTAQFGANSEAIADDMALLAWATRELSRDVESIAYSRRAIAAETALHGRVSSQVVSNLETLSSTEAHANDLASAERDQREAVVLATKLYGPAHRETIVARSNLYFIYYREGRYAQALAGHLDLLKLVQHMAKERPEQLAYNWNFIAIDYMQLARYDEALHAERQSLAAWANVNDSEYASNDSRTNLGTIFWRMGRLDEAEKTYLEALRIESKNESSDSTWVNRDLGFLGNVYRMQHRYAEAIAITSKALHNLPANSGPTSVRADLLSSLALAQLEAGDANAAESFAALALQTARIVYKQTPLSLSISEYVSARAALAHNQAARAESLLRAAYSARQTLASNDPRKVEVQVALIRALEMQGKRDEANALRVQVGPVLAASPSPYFADLRKSLDAN